MLSLVKGIKISYWDSTKNINPRLSRQIVKIGGNWI